MSNTRTATVLVILAIIVTGVSMANKPNLGDGINITVSPSTLVLNRYFADVTVHSNIDGSAPANELGLYRTIDGIKSSETIQPYLTKTDSMGHLVAKFKIYLVESIVDVGPVDLVLTRINTDDQVIFISKPDTIIVKYKE